MPVPSLLQHSLSCPKNCPACDARRDEKLPPKDFGRLYFYQAAPLWMKENRERVSQKTLEQHAYYIRTLNDFFGSLPLEDIHIGHIETFMDRRLQIDQVGASCVRHEVNCLGQILDRAGLWDAIKKHYHPPKLHKSQVGKALEDEDQERLFTVAVSTKRWRVCYWGSLVCAQTAADPGEIQHLHLNDIDLARQTMRIRDGLKNEHRDRIVELKELPDAIWALGQILKRYFRIMKRLGITPDPVHFILPGRARGGPYNPLRPMGSWKKAWGALREKAGLPNLRMKDLRHTALTKLLENPELSERTIIEIAGHVSKEMWSVYSHIRRKPKQEAMKTLHFERPQPPAVETVETVDIPADVGAKVHELKADKKV